MRYLCKKQWPFRSRIIFFGGVTDRKKRSPGICQQLKPFLALQYELFITPSRKYEYIKVIFKIGETDQYFILNPEHTLTMNR
jgi:hypothetical protein